MIDRATELVDRVLDRTIVSAPDREEWLDLAADWLEEGRAVAEIEGYIRGHFPNEYLR